MNDDVLILNSDNIIEIPALTNGLTGLPVNTASISLTLKDKNDADIAGEAWPIAMAYVAASDGVYRATAKDTLTLTHKQKVKAVVVADAGADYRRTWEKYFTVLIGSK